MSHTIIYGYFRNKQSLFEALKIEMLKILRQMMTEGDDPRAAPLERLRAAGRSLLCYARAYPTHYQFLFSSPVSKESGRDTLQARHAAFDFVVHLAMLADEKGSIMLEPRTLANLAWATLHGLIMLELSNQLREGRALEDLLEAALDLLFGPPGDQAN
jgi:AcrR family transcriptional regulator